MIKQKSFKPYPIEILPDGFIYPARYLQLANCTKTVQSDEYFQWWFYEFGTQAAELAFTLRNEDIEGFNLVPFAKNGDWLANFDGDDFSGDPKVIVVDLGDLPFYMTCENFTD